MMKHQSEKSTMTVKVGDYYVGPGCPCFIIAEVGVNHNGDLKLAQRLIQAAARANVDAVKFQSFRADRLASPIAPKAKYQLETTAPNQSQFEMLRALELSPVAHRRLQQYCIDSGVLFLSSPFDEESCDLLFELGVPAFKIGSGEITNEPLLKHVAGKKKPVLLSTGGSYLKEVEEAVETLRTAGNKELILLHCVSNYPADPGDANLRAISTMARVFGLPVGFSDHTTGIEIALAAVALGACVIEKHVTLDRNLPGPDHRISLEPDELADLVRGIRMVEQALGNGKKQPALKEIETITVVRKSLIAAQNIPAGVALTDELITSGRPGTGFLPGQRVRLIGRVTQRTILAGTVITAEMLSPATHEDKG